MSVGAIGGCSPAQSQAVQYRTASAANTGSSATAAAAPDGGAFIDAIASALSEIGVSAASETDTASESTASADPAKALDEFLHTLMETLRSQGADAAPQAGGPPPGPPPGGALQADLQSLADELSGTASSDSASALESAFSNLLGALGLDSEDAGSKLGQFLETLAAKLDASGPSGNLINTTA